VAEKPGGPSRADLVERRQRYIDRQIALDRRAVNVNFRGKRPEGTGPANRDGMPKLPVGQHEVKNWPVLDLGETPNVDIASWRLEVAGEIDNPFTLTWEQFLALPQADDVSDFHCVTTWSRYDNHWRGVRFRTIAELAVPRDDAHFVLCTGYDSMPGSSIPYTTNLPLARAVDDDVLLVHTWEGRPLPREHGGPCRMITPKLYAWKGAKWIRKIEFLPKDKKGFWEIRGYSNSAEPWFNDRYATS
jgi:DMSO/TMAO reductase YedYZ molybdopterin-dependent catalytic subunit